MTSPPAGSTPPACAAIEDDAIRDVVTLQEDLGLRVATDGEFRRTSWHMDFVYRLGGVVHTDEELVVQFRNDEGTGQFIAAGLAVRAPLHLDEPIFTDDFRFLSEQVRTATPKMTLPSPSMVLLRSGTAAVDRSVYPDLDEFWADLAAAYADEIRALHAVGCRYLQLDDTSLACLNDPSQRAAWPSGATTPSTRTSATSAPSTPRSPTGPTGCHRRPHVPRQLPLVLDRRGRLRLRRRGACSAGSTSTPSSASSTTSARAGSRRCASCRPASWSSSGWSPPSAAASRTPTRSSAASTRPPSTSRSTSSASPRSAGSPPRSRATCSTPYQEVDKLRLVVDVARDVWGDA